MSRIYVGNLARETDEASLRAVLAQDGRTVTNVLIKKNATSGKPRGFAFVDMGTEPEAEAAIAALQGHTLDGRVIKVGRAKTLTVRDASEPEYHRSGFSHGNRRGRR